MGMVFVKRTTVYNRNLVTEELWNKVNPENKSLLEEFLEYKKSTGKSEETIYQYSSQIKIFLVWLLEHAKNKEFIDINKRDIIKFQGYCINTLKHSPARVRSMRSAISSLSIYIENILDDLYPDFRNIVNKIEAPKLTPVREKVILNMDESLEVCEKLYNDNRIQLACFLSIAMFSGLRKQEMTRLLYEDFTTNVQIVHDCFYKTTPIKLKGDKNKKESKLIWNRCDKYLKAWIKYRQDNNINCKYLFCREDNGNYVKLLVSTINSYVETISSYYGYPVYMHSYRHLYSTFLLESGIPAEVVQMLLSHEDVSTTLKFYDDRDKDDTLKGFTDFFTGKTDTVDNKVNLNEL